MDANSPIATYDQREHEKKGGSFINRKKEWYNRQEGYGIQIRKPLTHTPPSASQIPSLEKIFSNIQTQSRVNWYEQLDTTSSHAEEAY